MADIEKLIQDLQSDDLEKRYDACKQLQGESYLPEEALDALHKVSNDPDPLIVVASQRALSRHTEVSYILPKETNIGETKVGYSRKKIIYTLLFSSFFCLLCSLPSFFLVKTAEGDFMNVAGLFAIVSIFLCGLVGMAIGLYITLEYTKGHTWNPPYYFPIIICIGLGLIFLVSGWFLLDYFYHINYIGFIIPFPLVGYSLGIIIVLTQNEGGFPLRTYIVAVIISLGLATIFTLTSFGIIFAAFYL